MAGIKTPQGAVRESAGIGQIDTGRSTENRGRGFFESSLGRLMVALAVSSAACVDISEPVADAAANAESPVQPDIDFRGDINGVNISGRAAPGTVVGISRLRAGKLLDGPSGIVVGDDGEFEVDLSFSDGEVGDVVEVTGLGGPALRYVLGEAPGKIPNMPKGHPVP